MISPSDIAVVGFLMSVFISVYQEYNSHLIPEWLFILLALVLLKMNFICTDNEKEQKDKIEQLEREIREIKKYKK